MNGGIGNGELLLGGGGDADDSRLLDERLVERVGDDDTMGYIPVAMPPAKYLDCAEWIRSVFDRHGLTEIDIWTDITEVTAGTIASVSAIYIGGGNTYRLLDEIRSADLETSLREFVSDGGVLYGGSAGAILCGETVETTPDENRRNVTDTAALGLLPNSDVWCHYGGSDDPDQYARVTDRTVVAIPERSGLSVTESRCRVVGHEPITVFRDGRKTTYAPDKRLQL